MKENLKIHYNSKDERIEIVGSIVDCALFNSCSFFCEDDFVHIVGKGLVFAYKEITLPELRELARPREYLNGKFELVVTNQPLDGFILVPDGAEYYADITGTGGYFYKFKQPFINLIIWHVPLKIWMQSGLSCNSLKNILWQRESKVEAVKGRFLHQWAYEAFGRGEELEYIFNNNPNDVWEIVNCNNVLLNIFNASTVSFRLKPKTIQIGSRTINKPISVKPEIGTEYFMPSLSSSCKYLYATWDDSNYDKEVLGRSLCHLTKEDAISHCEALLELMK